MSPQRFVEIFDARAEAVAVAERVMGALDGVNFLDVTNSSILDEIATRLNTTVDGARQQLLDLGLANFTLPLQEIPPPSRVPRLLLTSGFMVLATYHLLLRRQTRRLVERHGYAAATKLDKLD